VVTAVVTCGRRKLMRRLLDAGFKVHPQAGGCHSYHLGRADEIVSDVQMMKSQQGITPDFGGFRRL
jgi:hypothetical protein